ncbi:response regulator [Novosphingobium album (ex Liu et al. 2023)]|uniref:Response regulator n=1 Tax=Novosphingobium album (ex Liu et al. 2023) TaxID=3031130 RepID=A0ABT5WXI5_9SPHN|nr:response regulator [Novosphingobium album (ex Liu et al. 2023)]MDE8654618.1 response regulator [Novosphingobium album (ex Liu et al. 2023)]
MLVLIADDDPDWTNLASTWVEGEADTRHVTTRMFAEPDLMLQAVTEGSESVSKAVVFLDLEFSNKGVNGIDTLRRLKSHEDERVRNVPVVIYSRSASPEEIDESYANQANSFVNKGKGKRQKEIFLDTIRFWMQTAKLPS